MGRPRSVVAVCTAMGLVACGLSVVGVASDDVTTPDGGPSSSSGDGGRRAVDDASTNGEDGLADVVVCDGGTVAAGAIIVPADGTACPSGTTLQTVQKDPQALAGACSCGSCAPKTDPPCVDSSFTWSWGSTASCDNGVGSPATYNAGTPGACVNVSLLTGHANFSVDSYNRWSSLTPTGPGSCSAESIPDPSKVSATTMSTCVPNSVSAVCAALSAGQRICVPAVGDTCTGAYSHRVDVGDGATVSCDACDCTRTATACTVEYHDNATCTHMVYSTTADNQCNPTNSVSMQAIKLSAANPTCTPTPGAATATLTNARTFCCSP